MGAEQAGEDVRHVGAAGRDSREHGNHIYWRKTLPQQPSARLNRVKHVSILHNLFHSRPSPGGMGMGSPSGH